MVRYPPSGIVNFRGHLGRPLLSRMVTHSGAHQVHHLGQHLGQYPLSVPGLCLVLGHGVLP